MLSISRQHEEIVIDNLSNMNHDVLHGFARQVGHGGVSGGIAHRKQHQQLLIGWPLKENSQPGAAVEWRGRHRHETHVLKKRLDLSSQVNFICTALNHSYSLKGLYRPYDYGDM